MIFIVVFMLLFFYRCSWGSGLKLVMLVCFVFFMVALFLCLVVVCHSAAPGRGLLGLQSSLWTHDHPRMSHVGPVLCASG